MKKTLSFTIGLLACCVIGVVTTQGQTYVVKDIGVVPSMTASESGAINNKGHVTGSGYSDEGTCAFYYGNRLIFDAGGANSRGFAINSADFVAGDTYVTQN